MESDVLALSEKHFLEGKAAGDAGLAGDACPYPAATNEHIPPQPVMIARLNWMIGWKFARHAALLQARQTKRTEIVAALARMTAMEHAYGQHLETLRLGVWPNPFRYWKADQALTRLQKEVWQSHEYKFLRALAFHVYLPFHREKYKTFAVFDEQGKVFSTDHLNDWNRVLMRRHGYNHDRSSDPDLRELVAEAGGSDAIHVY